MLFFSRRLVIAAWAVLAAPFVVAGASYLAKALHDSSEAAHGRLFVVAAHGSLRPWVQAVVGIVWCVAYLVITASCSARRRWPYSAIALLASAVISPVLLFVYSRALLSLAAPDLYLGRTPVSLAFPLLLQCLLALPALVHASRSRQAKSLSAT